MKSSIWITLGCLMMMAGGAIAQNIIPDVQIIGVDDSAYPTVSIYLTAQDPITQAPLTDLTSENVQVTLPGGEAVTVSQVNAVRRPAFVMAVVDLTGSVSDEEYANQLIALEALAAQLNLPDDQLGVVGFDDQTALVLSPLQAPNTALDGLQDFSPAEDTSGNIYWDGVALAMNTLVASSSNARPVLVVITDTSDGDGQGVQPTNQIVARAQAFGIQSFGLYFINEGDTDIDEGLPTELQVLADATGGLAVRPEGEGQPDESVNDDASLSIAMIDIVQVLQAEYRVDVTLDTPANQAPNALDLVITYQGNTLPTLPVTLGANTQLPTATVMVTPTQAVTPSPAQTTATTPSTDSNGIASDENDDADSNNMLLFVVIGLAFLVGIGVAVGATIFLMRRSNQQSIAEFTPVAGYAPPVASIDTDAAQDMDDSEIDISDEDDPGDDLSVVPSEPIMDVEPVFETLDSEPEPSDDSLAPVTAEAPSTEPDMPPPVVPTASEPAFPPPVSASQALPLTATSVPSDTSTSGTGWILEMADGQQWAVQNGENTIGRHRTNDIMIEDASLSRYHAKIIFENGHCKLKDWQASHPSELNGALLEMGRQYPLKDGDRMRVGATLLVVRRL